MPDLFILISIFIQDRCFNCLLIDWFVNRSIRIHQSEMESTDDQAFLLLNAFSSLDIPRGYLIVVYTSDNLLIVEIKANAFAQSAHQLIQLVDFFLRLLSLFILYFGFSLQIFSRHSVYVHFQLESIMSMMPISANDLYHSYVSSWPFSSFNRHLYHQNEKYRVAPGTTRVTRFFIDDILADSKSSTMSESMPIKNRKGKLSTRRFESMISFSMIVFRTLSISFEQ